jgi:hypothetical protein
MPETPRYEHDCSPEHGCEFIGWLDDKDVWYHAEQSCIIYRYTSEPSNYGTGHLTTNVDEYCWPDTAVEFHRSLHHMVCEYLTRQHTEEMGIL